MFEQRLCTVKIRSCVCYWRQSNECLQCGSNCHAPVHVCACSWLQKLDLAKELIVDDSKDMRPGEGILAPVYIYLQWITTGSIGCVEGGGHYRPNRHAELAKIMFRSLEWVIGGANSTAIERTTARRLQVCRRATRAQGVPFLQLHSTVQAMHIPQKVTSLST